MRDRSAPTWDNQLWHARRLYWDAVDKARIPGHERHVLARQRMLKAGYDAVNNPHAMIGRECKCMSCFCCAALAVVREHVSFSGVQSAPD